MKKGLTFAIVWSVCSILLCRSGVSEFLACRGAISDNPGISSAAAGYVAMSATGALEIQSASCPPAPADYNKDCLVSFEDLALLAGDWIWNLEGFRRVLYRLPELLKASVQDFVYLTEGEKDTDRLCEMGFVATTCPMGAGKWRGEYNPFFAGRLVAIIPDNDAPGKKHAAQVADSLYGTAAKVRIVELPGLALKQDISDWLDNGGTGNELTRIFHRNLIYFDRQMA